MFVVTRPAGRLGNQLSTFAYLIANSVEYNRSVVNLPFIEYSKFFLGTVQDPLCRFPAKNDVFSNVLSNRLLSILFRAVDKLDAKTFRKIYRVDKGSLRSDSNSKQVAKHFITTPTSWWVSDYESLQKHAEVVRNFFSPSHEIKITLDDNESKLRQKGDLVIGVHIRRSDYKDVVPKYFYGHEIYANYIKDALKLFIDKHIVFFLTSDEPIPKEPYSEFNTLSFKQGAVEDMYTLARCDYIIGTKSSFNSWASFMGNTPTYWILGDNRRLDKKEFMVLPPGFIPQHASTSLCGKSHPYFHTQ